MKKQPPKKAVALKYNPVEHKAPHVVAKGSGFIAEKIIEEAKKHEVAVHEDKALIEMVYQLEIDEQIPAHLYPIIAEVFAMIYKAEQIAGKLKNVRKT